jgi:transposase
MDERRVVFVTPGKDAGVVERFASHLEEHNATPAQIQSVSIDMSPAFIKGVDEHLPDARVTFDKFHVISHASKALDGVRREQQKTDPALKGMRWSLLKDADKLNLAQLTDLEALISQYTTNRTARAWMYREQLREILDRKQIHVVSKMLRRWCTSVMRSKVEPMKDVARMILRHFDGIVAWAQTRQTAQGAGVRQLQNHANRAVPHRRKARLLGLQSACLVSRITHSTFEIALTGRWKLPSNEG